MSGFEARSGLDGWEIRASQQVVCLDQGSYLALQDVSHACTTHRRNCLGKTIECWCHVRTKRVIPDQILPALTSESRLQSWMRKFDRKVLIQAFISIVSLASTGRASASLLTPSTCISADTISRDDVAVCNSRNPSDRFGNTKERFMPPPIRNDDHRLLTSVPNLFCVIWTKKLIPGLCQTPLDYLLFRVCQSCGSFWWAEPFITTLNYRSSTASNNIGNVLLLYGDEGTLR